MEFTEKELSTIENALRIAREVYAKDAATVDCYSSRESQAAFDRVAKQFKKQIEECDSLIEKIGG